MSEEYETWSVDLAGKATLYIHYDRNRCQMWTDDVYNAKTMPPAAFSKIAWALREVGLKVTRI